MSRGSQGSPSVVPPGLKAVKHVAGRHWFGAYRNVVVAYWVETCTREELRSLRAIYQAMASEEKTSISVLHYVQQGAGLPVPDLQADFASKGESSRSSLGAVGVVLAGSGFWVSALSSFIVGVRLLMPKSTLRFRVTRDLGEMTPWFVAEHLSATGLRLDRALLPAWIEQASASVAGEQVP